MNSGSSQKRADKINNSLVEWNFNVGVISISVQTESLRLMYQIQYDCSKELLYGNTCVVRFHSINEIVFSLNTILTLTDSTAFYGFNHY